ncbi:DUF5655 domain-containing protein [Streptomyces sp. NBC_00090]|uniref:transporter n=1 Tax=Streptomyces sp. NBC_00090 TaxID=2903619 RepID=UPI00324BCE02
MSNLKVFRVRGGEATEVPGAAVGVEVELQRLIEANMETMLGIRFLATEHRTGRHGSRIDSLGLDETGTPVIVEYKRTRDEAVVVQALSYLCWLQDHHHEFEKLVAGKLGESVAEEIDWSAPRIVCIAGAFTYHETVAVEMISHRIDLLAYRIFDDALTLQLVTSTGGTRTTARGKTLPAARSASSSSKTFQQYHDESPADLKELFADLDELLLSHQDVIKEPQLHYVAYRRFTNVATVRMQPRKRQVVINLRLDPGAVELQEGFSRDISGVSALGLRGGVEVRISSREELARATDLIQQAVEAT